MDGCVPVPVPACRERFLEERVVVMGGERAAPRVDGLLCRCYPLSTLLLHLFPRYAKPESSGGN